MELMPIAMLCTGVALILMTMGWIGMIRRQRWLRAELERVCEQAGREHAISVGARRAAQVSNTALGKRLASDESIKQAERQRIARDIHDDLGQHLLSLKMDLSMLHLSTTGSAPQINQKLAAILKNLDLTIRSMRSIINDLRPIELDAGLPTAMQWQMNEFSRIHGIRYDLAIEKSAFDAPPHSELDAILFRVLQEALSNVARHAHATEVTVTLHRNQERLAMLVRDNGVGMPIQGGAGGCGLTGMQERVTSLGGAFHIDSQPGQGTTLSLEIPVGEISEIA